MKKGEKIMDCRKIFYLITMFSLWMAPCYAMRRPSGEDASASIPAGRDFKPPSYAMQGLGREGALASIPRTVGRNFQEETRRYVQQLPDEARSKLKELVRKDLDDQPSAQKAESRPPTSLLARSSGDGADVGGAHVDSGFPQAPLTPTSGRADSDVESGVEKPDLGCCRFCKKGPRTTHERMRRPKVLPKGAQVESMTEEELKQKVAAFILDGIVHNFTRAHDLSENAFRYTRFAGLSAAAKVITGLLGVLQATNFGLPESVGLGAPYIAFSLGLASTLAVGLDGVWFSRSAAAYDEAPQKYENFLNELTDKFINDADLKTVNRKIEIRQLIEKALKERAGLDKK